MKKINVGFDLGVSSVGWAVYNTDDNVLVDYGVKLYEQANKADDRRGHRSLRRRYNRQSHRIERFEQLLKNSGISYQSITDNKMLEKRIKGLNEKIELNEIINILRFFLKFRGYIPFADDTRENAYKKNNPELFACEIQKIILEENGHYRGIEYPFLVQDFQKEIKKLLETQSRYNELITEEFISEYFKIFNSRREFWEGPGGKRKDQITPFGRYKSIDDVKKAQEDDTYNKYLFEELIKSCSVYIGEKSVPKENYYAQRFNFLNDMINIKVPMDEYNGEEKYINEFNGDKECYHLNLIAINEIEKQIFDGNKTNFKTIFKNIFKTDIDKFLGFRVDKSGKKEITKFEIQKKVINKFRENNLPIDKIMDSILWNETVYILTVSPASNVREMLEYKLGDKYTEIEKKILCEIRLPENNYHSFSEKALKVYIKLMEENLCNSSKVEREYKHIIKSDVQEEMIKNYFVDDKIKMNNKFIEDLVASPQVKKTLRKSFATLNQIIETYNSKSGYIISNIVIESNSELNNAKRINEINEEQGQNERKRKQAFKKIENKITEGQNPNTLIEKQLLLDETNGKCIKCDIPINIDNMEIEHALPYSLSADNSFANKVACCKECNSKKKNKTYFQFIGEHDFSEFTKKVNAMKISQKKKENLLFKDNIDKYSKRFINRNLRDTSYATKEFKNQINLFLEAIKYKTGLEHEIKVIAMPPYITNNTRKVEGLKKNRENLYHHAVDAAICTMFATTKLGKFSSEIQNDPSSFWKIDNNNFKSLGNPQKQVLEEKHFKELFKINYDNTKFAFEVKNKSNGQLCNADISKVLIDENKKGKKEYRKVEYISSIYELEGEKLQKFYKQLKNETKETLGIVANNSPVVEYLINIYEEYIDRKWINEKDKEVKLNPFIHYIVEQENLTPTEIQENISKYGLRVPTKKGNGPVIKKITYAKNVTKPFILNKKNVKLNQDNYIMLDSLKMSHTEIYQDIKSKKYYFVPVYLVCCNLKTGKVNKQHHYYQQFYQEFIGNREVEFIMNIRTNEYVKITKKNGECYESRVYGYHKTLNKLSLKNGKAFTVNDLAIEKIPVYGLGRRNLKLYEEKK